MSKEDLLAEILRLPSDERRSLLEEAYNSLPDTAPDPDMTPKLAAELDRRWQHFMDHPEDCMTVDEVLAELDRRKAQKDSPGMRYDISLQRFAVDDIANAVERYDAQQEGLGDRFRNTVARMLRRIHQHPLHYARSLENPNYRKGVLDIFPYCIYYRIYEQKIVVVAVHDARSDPQKWQERTS